MHHSEKTAAGSTQWPSNATTSSRRPHDTSSATNASSVTLRDTSVARVASSGTWKEIPGERRLAPAGLPRGVGARWESVGRSCRVAGSRGVEAVWVECGEPSKRRWRRKTVVKVDASLASGREFRSSAMSASPGDKVHSILVVEAL